MVTIIALVALFNGLTFVVYWADKQAARAGNRRISEATLLWLALLGGWICAIAAQRLLRHKTRKQPFATILAGIPLVHGAALIAVVLAPEIFDAATALLPGGG